MGDELDEFVETTRELLQQMPALRAALKATGKLTINAGTVLSGLTEIGQAIVELGPDGLRKLRGESGG